MVLRGYRAVWELKSPPVSLESYGQNMLSCPLPDTRPTLAKQKTHPRAFSLSKATISHHTDACRWMPSRTPCSPARVKPSTGNALMWKLATKMVHAWRTSSSCVPFLGGFSISTESAECVTYGAAGTANPHLSSKTKRRPVHLRPRDGSHFSGTPRAHAATYGGVRFIFFSGSSREALYTISK